MSRSTQVAIIGAGPYALATGAYLRRAGIETQLFGEVMGFWRSMPAGMMLRSYRRASNIADPDDRLTIRGYELAVGALVPNPIPLSDFIAYGEWFAETAGLDVDPRFVSRLAQAGDGFALELADGTSLAAERVVVAAGIAPFAWTPPLYAGLDRALVSHTSEHGDYAGFGGRQVAVIGSGQSALEAAILLAEAGATSELIVRRPSLRFLRGEQLYETGRRVSDVLYPAWGVGPPGINRLMGRPAIYRLLPRMVAEPLARRSIRPAGAAWTAPRLAGVRVTCGRAVMAAEPAGELLRLTLDGGEERLIEHLFLGTGYRIDVSRYPFLDPALAERIRLIGSYPRLSGGFETSVRGLHMVGAPAAVSAGPGMRFVSHTGFVAEAITGTALTRAGGSRAARHDPVRGVA